MNTQSTSFIPQRPTQGKVKNRSVRKVYILAYISYVLFFATLLSTGGVLFYKYALNATLNDEKATLAGKKDAFSESDIASVKDLDQRLNLASKKLNDHISVSAIFAALESSAVQSIQFDSFEYTRAADGMPSIILKGSLNQFNSLIFQREVFKTNPILANAAFSEISSVAQSVDSKTKTESAVADQQIITFTMNKDVETSLIPYVPHAVSNTAVMQQTDAGALPTPSVDTVSDQSINVGDQ